MRATCAYETTEVSFCDIFELMLDVLFYRRVFCPWLRVCVSEYSRVTFWIGDVLEITQEDDSGWWLCVNVVTKKSGYCPSNYLEPCAAPAAAKAAPTAPPVRDLAAEEEAAVCALFRSLCISHGRICCAQRRKAEEEAEARRLEEEARRKAEEEARKAEEVRKEAEVYPHELQGQR